MPKVDPYEGIRSGPNTPGVYDIVGNYDWTSLPKGATLRNEAPSAYITAYELEYSQLRSFIDGYMNILSPQNSSGAYKGKSAGLDFYKGLYSVNETPIARFNFPFFGDSFRSFSSEFADTFSPISQRGAQMFGGKEIQGLGAGAEAIAGGGVAAVNALASFGDNANIGGNSLQDKIAKTVSGGAGAAAKALGLNPGMQTIGSPGTYIETPKFYQYSNTDNGLQIAFTLSNTLDDDSVEKNFKFICDFTKINRPYRYGPIGMNFPAIYNLVVPGLRYIQWAFLEGFDVSLLGNRRKIKNHIIPEAYVCQFNFRSLTLEPANFIDEICEERTNLGSFAAYSAEQVEQEKEFQKGKSEREAARLTRREFAEQQARQNAYMLPRATAPVQIINENEASTEDIKRNLKRQEERGGNGGFQEEELQITPFPESQNSEEQRQNLNEEIRNFRRNRYPDRRGVPDNQLESLVNPGAPDGFSTPRPKIVDETNPNFIGPPAPYRGPELTPGKKVESTEKIKSDLNNFVENIKDKQKQDETPEMKAYKEYVERNRQKAEARRKKAKNLGNLPGGTRSGSGIPGT